MWRRRRREKLFTAVAGPSSHAHLCLVPAGSVGMCAQTEEEEEEEHAHSAAQRTQKRLL